MKLEKRWLPNISARGERARRVAKRFCGRLWCWNSDSSIRDWLISKKCSRHRMSWYSSRSCKCPITLWLSLRIVLPKSTVSNTLSQNCHANLLTEYNNNLRVVIPNSFSISRVVSPNLYSLFRPLHFLLLKLCVIKQAFWLYDLDIAKLSLTHYTMLFRKPCMNYWVQTLYNFTAVWAEYM